MAEKIICVVGPTACGKTRLGVLLAKKYDGEVVSADSMQIYKGMTIGTAAPTEDEMEGVPHHNDRRGRPGGAVVRRPVRPGGHPHRGGHPGPGESGPSWWEAPGCGWTRW